MFQGSIVSVVEARLEATSGEEAERGGLCCVLLSLKKKTPTSENSQQVKTSSALFE
jgi:hypothetical protein